MLKNYNIQHVKNIEQGNNGTVVEIKHPKYIDNLEAKFILSFDQANSESVIWKDVHHENVVPLLASFTFESLKTIVLLMPLYKKTLFDSMKDEGFRSILQSSGVD